MEHANLIGSITKITPILIEYDIVFGVAVDGDLNMNNSDLILPEPNLIGKSNLQSNALKEFLKRITQLVPYQSLITKIRTSQNESVNRIKLNYTDKKQDYPKSYKTRYALADLVLYGKLVQDNITKYTFQLSFSELILCEGCSSFSKKFPEQDLCKSSIQSKSNLIKIALLEIFNLQHFKELQFESIESFILNKDILTIMPTGGGKTLIFSIASILFYRLILRELINIGIPSAYLFAATDQPLDIQKKIFAKIASGFIKVLWIIPEKFIQNF
ncbi:ATP dependent DNA helicase [Gigaspora margarita]|uniref:ATP dependent DNA helicase n=1 Tax=Gigaspora margarita TaxID=4874 RepID=A0A8H4B206_GIGMA|nr:ATP dependent DNA helicase [Gigaspora margarita]